MTAPRVPPRGLRRITPRCCGNCAFGQWDTGVSLPAIECLRPDGPVFDANDGEHWYHACDLWKAPGPEGPPTRQGDE